MTCPTLRACAALYFRAVRIKKGHVWRFDLSKPPGEIASQLRAQLQLARSPIRGGAGLALFSDDERVVFEQLVQTVGLERLLLLQPKQVECSGVRELEPALQWIRICLVPVVDHDSDMSEMSITHDSSFTAGFVSTDPLELESEGPTDLQDGEIIDNPCAPEPMEQSEELGHGAQPGGSTLSDLSPIPSGVSDFPSEDMDTNAHTSESESHSSLPTTSQGTGLSHGDLHDSLWGGKERQGD